MLKAMAYGCAVVALDTPFTREMCDNEKHAVYFTKTEGNLKNIIEVIEANKEIINSMRLTSRNRILENYTWEKITNQYIELFNKMITK